MKKIIQDGVIYTDISDSTETIFKISNPKTYIFYFKNKQGDLNFEISSKNAKIYIFGVYDAHKNETFSLNTYQIHKVENSESHLFLKGVFRKNSSLTYKGTVDIKKEASNSVATLENKNILLGKNASVTTNPILKIKPHKVKCTHGATIADIDEDHITFLESRGIDRKNAKNLLISGFLLEIKQKIESLLLTNNTK